MVTKEYFFLKTINELMGFYILCVFQSMVGVIIIIIFDAHIILFQTIGERVLSVWFLFSLDMSTPGLAINSCFTKSPRIF